MAELAVPVTTRFATLLIFAWLLIASPSRAAGLPGKWEIRAPMPSARGALAVGVLGGKIFAVGGIGTNGKNTGANEEYDPGATFSSVNEVFTPIK